MQISDERKLLYGIPLEDIQKENKIDYARSKLYGGPDSLLFNQKDISNTENENRAWWRRALGNVSEWAVGEEADWGTYLKRGLGQSNINLYLQQAQDRGIDYQEAFSAEPEDTGIAERFVETLTAIAADTPTYLAGAAVGGLMTRSPTLTAGAAGFVNDSVKGMYLAALQRGDVDTFSEYWDMFLQHGVEEGVKGGLYMGAMGAAPAILAPLGVPINKATVAASRWAGLTGAGIAIEKELPTKETLINNALLLGVFGAVDPKARKMVEISALKNKQNPTQITLDMSKNEVMKQELLSINTKIFSRDKKIVELEVLNLKEELAQLNKIDQEAAPKIIVSKDAEILKIEKDIKKIEETLSNPALESSLKTLNQTNLDILRQDLRDIKEATGKIIEEKDVPKFNRDRKKNLQKELDALNKKQIELVKALNLTQKKVEQMGEGGAPPAAVNKLKKSITQNQEKIDTTTKLINKDQRIKQIEKELDDLGQPVEKIFDKDVDRKNHPDPDINFIMGKTALGKVKYTETGSQSFFAKVQSQYIDKLYPIKKAVKESKEKGIDQAGSLDVYKQFRLQLGSIGKGFHFIERGTLDFFTLKKTGRSFQQILKDVISSRKSYEEFTSFAIAKRALEKYKQGISTDYSLTSKDRAVLQRTIKNYEGKYGRAFDEINLYQQRVLTYMQDSGLLSPELYKTILQLNKDYVPLNKVLDPSVPKTSSGLGSIVKNPMKEMKGSVKGKATIDPIETMFLNTLHFVQLAEKNVVNKAFIDLALRSKDLVDAFSVVKEVKNLKETKLNAAEINALFDGKQKISDSVSRNMIVFRKDNSLIKDTQIAVYDKGKLKVYEIGAEFADAIRGQNTFASNIFMQIAATPTRLLRAGATLDPSFIFKNFGRDTFFASVFSQNTFIPILTSFRGMFSVIKSKTKNGDALFDDFMKSGGLQSTMISVDKSYFREGQMLKEMSTVNKKLLNSINPRNYLEHLRVFAEIFEQASRVGDFRLTIKRLKKENLKLPTEKRLTEREIIETAGFEARDLTIDFRKMGMRVEGLNMVTAFLNARIQGYAKIAEGLANPKTRNKMIRTATITITLPSVTLWFANKDSETYKKLPQWQKDLNWIIIANEGEENETVYRIPKPFEIGWVFGSLPERMLDFMYSKNPEPFNQSLLEFTKNLTINSLPFPDFMRPFIDDSRNQNAFYKRPIVPYRLEKVLPQYQYNEYTSTTAKFIASVFDKLAVATGTELNFVGPSLNSPAKVDNYINAWTGGLGKYLLDSIDAIQSYRQKTFGEEPVPVKPWSDDWVKNLSEIPVVRSFVIRNPSASTQPLNNFWKKYNKISKYQNTYDLLVRNEENVNAMEFFKNKLIPIAYTEGNFLLFQYAPLIKEHGDMIKYIEKNLEMSADEKRQLIDGIYRNMARLAETALLTIEATENTNKQ
tara:strand:- start:2093 stop:6358 length:4266 start_codon:yes stop_codon:yes gene_type:complete